jgi:hypothetical protein
MYNLANEAHCVKANAMEVLVESGTEILSRAKF